MYLNELLILENPYFDITFIKLYDVDHPFIDFGRQYCGLFGGCICTTKAADLKIYT